MVLLVGLTGVASSGKTTLVNSMRDELEKRGYNVYCVKELVRELLERIGLNLKEIRMDKDKYLEFQRILYLRFCGEVLRHRVEDEYDVVLFDRTIYDVLAYTLIFHGIVGLTKVMEIPSSRVDYDLLVYCEKLDFVDDGVRDKTKYDEEIFVFENYVRPHADVILTSKMNFNERKKVLLRHILDRLRY